MTFAGLSAGGGIDASRVALAWGLTYAAHAAVVCTGAAALVRFARPAAAAEHRLWTMALFLPVATASLATLLAFAPAESIPIVRAHVVVPLPEAPRGVRSTVAPARLDAIAAGVAALGVLATAAGMARFAVGATRFRMRLRGRRRVTDPRLRSSLARVAPSFSTGPIQLTESERLASPAVLSSREICVPAGRLATLTDVEIDAVIAHELAHLERGDAPWFFAVGLIEGGLWMQPLNHWLATRVRRAAEIACDDRAVDSTGDPLALAHALGRLAHASSGAGDVAYPGAVRSSGALIARIRRLARAARPEADTIPHPARSLAAPALLAAVAFASADLSLATARAPAVLVPTARGAGDGSDPAAVRIRARELSSREQSLEATLEYARGAAGGDTASLDDRRVLELEQDLRHAREERVWLEHRADQAPPQ